MQVWQVAVVILLAVLVGAALPALIQLWTTLRTARSFVTTSGPQLDRTLHEVTATAARVGDLAGSAQAVSDKIPLAAAIGAVVGPALGAAIRAFRAPAHPAVMERRTLMSGQDDKTVVVRQSGFGGGQILLAFAGGALAGAIAALLLAPRSGAETRAKVRDLADRAKEKVAHLPEAIHEAGAAAKKAFVNSEGSKHQ